MELMIPNKYFIKVNFTKHADDRVERFFGVSKEFIIKDIRQEIFNTCKERSNNIYMLTGRLGRYIYEIENSNINLITILYITRKKNKKDKYFGREYISLKKEEIKNIFKII